MLEVWVWIATRHAEARMAPASITLVCRNLQLKTLGSTRLPFAVEMRHDDWPEALPSHRTPSKCQGLAGCVPPKQSIQVGEEAKSAGDQQGIKCIGQTSCVCVCVNSQRSLLLCKVLARRVKARQSRTLWNHAGVVTRLIQKRKTIEGNELIRKPVSRSGWTPLCLRGSLAPTKAAPLAWH